MDNQLKTAALLAALSVLLIAISYWIIGGSAGLVIGIVIAAVTNLVSWYQSDKIALAAYGAQPISPSDAPGLYRMVERLSTKENIPTPKVGCHSATNANAGKSSFRAFINYQSFKRQILGQLI